MSRLEIDATEPAFRFPPVPAVDGGQSLSEFPNRNVPQHNRTANGFEFESINVVAGAEALWNASSPFFLPIFVGFGLAAFANATDQRRSALLQIRFFWNPICRVIIMAGKWSASCVRIVELTVLDPVNGAVVELFQSPKRHAKRAGKRSPVRTG